MSITHIRPGKRLSAAVAHRGTLYLSGQVPTDVDGDVGQQTAQVLAKIDALLAEAGSSRTRILSAQIYLREITDFAGMNTAWEAWLDGVNAPSRTTVQAPMANPGYRVEITVTAATDVA